MRKIIAFLFLVALLWNYTGFFGYFQLERMKIRKEIKTQLKLAQPLQNLKRFVFDKTEISKLKWTKSNEFRWKNNMFDIVHTRFLKGNKIEYLCISDTQESKLFRFLDEMVSHGVSKNKPVQVWSFVFQQPFDIQIFDIVPNLFRIAFKEKQNFHCAISAPFSGYLDELSHPPIF